MLELHVFPTVEATTSQLTELRRFVEDAFDGDFSDDDWAHALGGTHVVVRDRDVVLAHASVVARTLDVGGVPFPTGYVESVATAADHRGAGLGTTVMGEIGGVIRRDFNLGALSTGSHHFYERLGWERWGGKTLVRDPATGELQRTPFDDDAVMVLRCDRSAAIDPTSPIVCEARPGDPW
jgi:aminoglycoside 2'-N-acetyltransferase I